MDRRQLIESPALAAEMSDTGAALTGLAKRDGENRIQLMGAWPSSSGGMTSGFVMVPAIGFVSESGRVTHEGQVYEPGKHGFARKAGYAVARGENEIAFAHRHDPQADPGKWPFPYGLEFVYGVVKNEVTIRVMLENLGDKEMRFGAGLHPAFAWPLPGSHAKEDHTLALLGPLPAGTRIYRPVDGKVYADALAENPFRDAIWDLTPAAFGKDAYFFVFPEGTSAKVGFVLDAPHAATSLRFSMNGWGGFGVWNKPGHNMLCVEPFTGVSIIDRAAPAVPELSAVQGLAHLPKGGKFDARMTICAL